MSDASEPTTEELAQGLEALSPSSSEDWPPSLQIERRTLLAAAQRLRQLEAERDLMSNHLAQIQTWSEDYDVENPSPWHCVASAIAATIENLRSQLAESQREANEAKRDSERLDWLGDTWLSFDALCRKWSSADAPFNLRQAIDESRAREAEESKNA